MKKAFLRTFSALMCIIMVLTLIGGCSAPADDHDHDDDLVELDPEDVPLASGKCDGNHDIKVTTKLVNVCGYDDSEVAFNECQTCGFTYCTAIRPRDPSKKQGNHEWENKDYGSVCSSNPAQSQKCKKCDLYQSVSVGGHEWGEWKIDGDECTGREYRTCSSCNTREDGAYRTHDWVNVSTTPATCTEPEKTTQKCSVCHTTQTIFGAAALGHNYRNEWKSGNEGHFKDCVRCGQTTLFGAHTPDSNGTCTVCGFTDPNYKPANTQPTNPAPADNTTPTKPDPATCEHTFGYWGSSNAGSIKQHSRTCTKCGYKETENCWDTPAKRTNCTKSLQCAVCGTVLEAGYKSHLFSYGNLTGTSHESKCTRDGCQETKGAEAHSFAASSDCTASKKCTVCGYTTGASGNSHSWGAWKDNGNGTHSRSCQNSGCTATESKGHTVSSSGDHTKDVVCTDCGAVVVKGTATHTWGRWTTNGSSGHSRTCTVPGCTAKETASHSGGTATCSTLAQCKDCGASYGQKNSTNHVGGTEVRNAATAQIGVAGYTGDTYCLGCGQKTASGQAIPALTETHVHNYTTLQHDSTGHWKVCECGERETVAPHTGGTATCAEQAVCSVCGEKYGELNSANHVGGTELSNVLAATVGSEGYTGDVHCRGCGALLEEGKAIPALAPEHTHSHTQKNDSVSHWKECECGEVLEKAEHTYANGKCTVCEAQEPEKVEVHVHSYSTEYVTDSANHWRVCATCGAAADIEPHVFMNGDCATCGYDEVVEAAAEEAAHNVVNVFSDVEADSFYTQSIQKMYDAGVMKGSGESFNVNGTANRKEFITVLARLNEVEGSFGATWDTSSVAWAVKNGYAEEGDVNAQVTREEIVTMLWKMAGKPTVEYDLSSYSDAGSLSGELLQAMQWAVYEGIMTGRGNNLDLESSANRGEIATFVSRFLDKTEE